MKKNLIVSGIRFISLMVILACVLTACKKGIPVKGGLLPPYVQGELVVWRKPGVDYDAWKQAKVDFQNKNGGTVVVKKYCESCDADLELWTGTAVENFISTETARPRTTGGSGIGASGEDDVMAYAFNFVVSLPFEGTLPDDPITNQPPTTGLDKSPVVVAVFDTGLDPIVSSSPWNATVSGTCITGAERGWDFIANTSDVRDAFVGKHGTIVSGLIIDQAIRHADATNSPRILPVKIFNADGKSDLFSVLCGFAYARSAGAKIINASFGFYYYDSEPPVLLRKYIEEVLTKSGILLVAAAGNKIETEDPIARIALGIPTNQLRNLDAHPFYPGGLSTLWNVFCVTTGNLDVTPVISPNQNYSNNLVNAAALSDYTAGYAFDNPFFPGLESYAIKGSSFAAPVLTGKLACWYTAAVQGKSNKDDINFGLKSEGQMQESTLLAPWVVGGNYIQR